MASSERPAEKRQRIDDQELTISPTRSELWFDDGSIILETQGLMQFRVHRSILSAHSQIFKDMLAVPQPPMSEDVIEGCPVVRLTDSAEDWKHVLQALYERRYCMPANVLKSYH
jgi:hypothetical protein